VTVDDPHGVAAGEGEKLPDEDADDELGEIHLETHEAYEYEVDENQEEGVEQRPEEAEKRALVALLQVAADEIADQLMAGDQFVYEVCVLHFRALSGGPAHAVLPSGRVHYGVDKSKF
jgi:hypothetical protein